MSTKMSIADKRRGELAELSQLIQRHAPSNGESACEVPNVFLTSRTVANQCEGAFDPSLMVFAQGKKDVRIGKDSYLCDSGSFLLSSVALPLGGLIVQATKQKPLLILRLTIDMRLVRDVLASKSFSESATPRARGIVRGLSTPELLNACSRLLELLDSPTDIPYLSPHIQVEILYRLLRMPQGATLRHIATSGDATNRIANAVSWIKRHYAKPVHMAELAAMAGVGQATFNAKFRALTGLSPLQYQKQLKLFAAQDRMVIEGEDASAAAYAVGYESVSQFNREYSRLFGAPPMKDVRSRRVGKRETT